MGSLSHRSWSQISTPVVEYHCWPRCAEGKRHRNSHRNPGKIQKPVKTAVCVKMSKKYSYYSHFISSRYYNNSPQRKWNGNPRCWYQSMFLHLSFFHRFSTVTDPSADIILITHNHMEKDHKILTITSSGQLHNKHILGKPHLVSQEGRTKFGTDKVLHGHPQREDEVEDPSADIILITHNHMEKDHKILGQLHNKHILGKPHLVSQEGRTKFGRLPTKYSTAIHREKMRWKAPRM